jgi:outer membrane biosynthesis protein TonB
MAGVTNKRPKVVLVKKDAVNQAGSFLDTLPAKPKESFSLRAAVEQLREPIRAALAKGYSYEEVAELLAKQGITISPSTLKNYAPSGTRQSKGDAKGRKATEESTPVTPSTESVSPPPAKSEPKEKVTPIAATKKTAAKTAAQPAKSRTRTTAAKTAAAEPTTKTAAKTKASTSKQTTAAKTAKKPAATKARTRTTTKK